MSLNLLNILESIITLSIFYMFYIIHLRKETFFKMNRIYLISTLIFSSIIPFLNLEVDFFSMSNFHNRAHPIINIKQGYIELNEVVIYASIGKPTWSLMLEYLGIIYLLGAFISFSFFLTGFIQIFGFIRKSTPKNYGRYKIAESTKILVPVSLFRWIIINPEKYSSRDMEQIIAHERMHAFQLHSIDLIIVEVLVILFWFNPFIYWYRKSIREVHEYLADQAVVESGYDRIEYQQLLLSQYTGCRNIGLTSRFSYSLSKNRLKMLTMMKSKSISKIKIALVIPVIVAALFLFANPVEMVKANENSIYSDEFTIKQDTIDNNDVEVIQDGEYTITIAKGEIFIEVEDMPKFNGQGADEFRIFIAENLTYPEEARKKKEEGRVFVSFIVNKEGYVQDVEVARGVSPSLDKEALRVTKSSPKWEPGYQNGKAVNVRFTFPIVFKLK